jgi:Pectate lyase
MIEPAFGFGKDVTGGGNATVTRVKNGSQLATQLTSLNGATTSTTPTVIELRTGTYDFGDNGQSFPINAKNLTIRGTNGVMVRNLNLKLDPTNVDNILIQDIVFQSSGKDNVARDAIDLQTPQPAATDTEPATATSTTSSVRISHCTFSGYYDIAIDIATRRDRPGVLATIDHCLFVDNNPGENTAGNTFVNRGAINVAGSRTGNIRLRGHAQVTIANNVFVKIWRRTPRVVEGTFAHIFNNVLYRWGIGNRTDDTWGGMEIGGGDGETSGQPNGTALIQANRTIPWKKKTDIDKEIEIGGNAIVDLNSASGAAFPNRFDDDKGRKLASPTLPKAPTAGFTTVTLPAAAGTQMPVAFGNVNWKQLVKNAGPVGISNRSVHGLLGLL